MEWISIEQRLPDEGERVLLYTPYPVFGEDHSCVGNRESISACTICEGSREVSIFTHWMPLPPSPERCCKKTRGRH